MSKPTTENKRAREFLLTVKKDSPDSHIIRLFFNKFVKMGHFKAEEQLHVIEFSEVERLKQELDRIECVECGNRSCTPIGMKLLQENSALRSKLHARGLCLEKRDEKINKGEDMSFFDEVNRVKEAPADSYARNILKDARIIELTRQNKILREAFQKAANIWRSSVATANELLIASGDICGEELEDGSMDYSDESEDPERIQKLFDEALKAGG